MSLTIIVAMDVNGLIGSNNGLPWYLPRDLKRVKEITTSHTIVMGRKNYESIGHPLPNRKNVVLTRNPDYEAEGCVVIHDYKEVLEKKDTSEEIFIFGGSEIYKIFLPYVNTIYLTRVHHRFDGDVYFPEIDWNDWEEIFMEHHESDEWNRYPHTFYIYERKRTDEMI